MPRRPIDPVLFETCRQKFLAGGTIRALAAEHGIGVCTLRDRAVAEGWQAERVKIIPKRNPAVAALVKAADARAAAVAQSYESTIRPLCDQIGQMVTQEMDQLNAQDKVGTWQDRASLIKLLIDALSRLREMLPPVQDTAAAAELFMEDRLSRLSPDQLRTLIAIREILDAP